jgi:chromate transporter
MPPSTGQTDMPAPTDDRAARLRDLAALFLRLGATAFGGPAAHIALMEREVVQRRAWLTQEEFVDLLGATNLIPGPNSTELAIHIGHRRAGWPGLIVAGACFIMPAVSIVYALGWAYLRYGRLPAVEHVMAAIKPVMLAIVVQALIRLGRTTLKSGPLVALGLLGAGAAAAGVHELLVLAISGGLVLGVRAWRDRGPPGGLATAASLWPGWLALTSGAGLAVPVSASKLFFVFLKIGSVLFGSGYVLLAFIRANFVERLHWLTEAQMLDAIAVGQLTPGPVFTTATFVGYLVDGTRGAATATAGIFLPAFVFVAVSGPLVPRLRRSRLASGFLDGINVASLALMFVVTAQLGRAAIVDGFTAALALAAAGLLLFTRVNPLWPMLIAAGLGALVPLVG